VAFYCEPLYLHDWYGANAIQVFNDYKVAEADRVGVTILFASYTYEDYSGDAFVLFEKDGKYFEVHGGHCSCYGLEDQWSPEEIELDVLLERIKRKELDDKADEYVTQLIRILTPLTSDNVIDAQKRALQL
jgi:hypothetical protein